MAKCRNCPHDEMDDHYMDPDLGIPCCEYCPCHTTPRCGDCGAG